MDVPYFIDLIVNLPHESAFSRVHAKEDAEPKQIKTNDPQKIAAFFGQKVNG